MSDSAIPFGVYLRGARLGWRPSLKHGAMVRLSAPVNGRCLVQLYPLGQLMPSQKKTRCAKYVCWWDDPEMLDLIPELQYVRRVKRPIAFEVAA